MLFQIKAYTAELTLQKEKKLQLHTPIYFVRRRKETKISIGSGILLVPVSVVIYQERYDLNNKKIHDDIS